MNLDLSNLTVNEKESIMKVLQRDEALRKLEDRRIFHLKVELQHLRKRGALRPGLDPSRSCARCLATLGRFLNRGAQCPGCRKKVCKDCRLYEPQGSEWICIMCQKQMELKAVSGQWMQDLCCRPSRRSSLKGPPIGYLVSKTLAPSIVRSEPALDSAVEVQPVGSDSEVSSLYPSNYSNKENILKLINPKSSNIQQTKLNMGNKPVSPLSSPTSKGRKVPLRASLRKLPHQSSLSSSSDSLPEIKLSCSPKVSPRLSHQQRTVNFLEGNSARREVCTPSYIRNDGDCCPVPFSKEHNSPQRHKGIQNPELLPVSMEKVALKCSFPEVSSLTILSREVSGLSSSPVKKHCASSIPYQETDISKVPRSQEIACLNRRDSPDLIFRRVTIKQKPELDNADDSSGSHRSSPRGRLRSRVRHPSGGSDDARPSSIPAINISTGENSSVRSSLTSTDKDSLLQEEDVEHIYTAYSRSQTSLSSIGQARSESMTSVYSAAGGGRYGTVTVTGEVFFGLVYNYKCGTMEVHVKECRNLAPVDTKRNRSDPYVKVYLLPDKTKSGKRKTKVKKHTLSPVFDEVLKFKVTISELETRTLWLSVWHSDMFGRNDFLGEVMLTLGYEAFENSGIRWYPLQERLESPETPLTYKGDLILSLKYMPPDVTRKVQQAGTPKKGSLHILVKEARNLMATRSNGTSDPFCKSYLLPDKTKGSKQKTPVMKKTCSPKWNHTFVYPDISLEELKERCLELTVWDYDKITSNDFLGGVRLGLGTGKYQGKDVDWMDSQGEEVTLWRAMVERPNLWIDGSLLLRPTLQSRR